MLPWDSLTEVGQIRRLRDLALRALKGFGIEPRRLRLVGGFTNVVFRVDTDRGPLALRVDLHQEHSDADVDNELAWLRALEGSGLDVCRYLRAADGRDYVYERAAGVPGARRCVLFHWVPGRPLGRAPSPAGYRRLGRLSAGLHEHGAGFDPPHVPLTWDRLFFWPEEVDPVVVFEPHMAKHLRGGRRELLDAAVVKVERAFARLGSGGAQLVHGDLHPHNVHVCRARVIALDFEDVTWAHRVQDLAVTLLPSFTEPEHASYREAFERGYREVAAWPVAYAGELELFMAARAIMMINYVGHLRPDPSSYYETAFPRLARLLGGA